MAMTAFSRQHEAWERQEDVGNAHQDRVDPIAEIARGEPDREADRRDDRGDESDDDQGGARTEHDASENIPPQLIGTKPMGPGGRLQTLGEHLQGRGAGIDEQRSRERRQDQCRHDEKARHGKSVASKGKPGPKPASEARLLPARGRRVEQPSPPCERRAHRRSRARGSTRG
jgi:hypothetical protein